MKSLMLLLAFGLAASEKLDRTYLPPPGSKYAGGSQGDLQVPLDYSKVAYTTTAPIKLGSSNDQRITSPEDTQAVPGIQRIPGGSYQGPQDLVPVATPNRQFSYNVPTTTTSYAFTQTTTFPPIEGFETTISPLAQGFDVNSSVKPPSGLVNQLLNQNQNYPQSQVTQGRPVIQPGQVTQFPGIIRPRTNIPASQTTISRSQTITGQPDYAQIQNQYTFPSSTILPTTIIQPGVQSYNQGYTQHLGVQPPRQLINQEYTATPTPFPQYPSNVPIYQNTSFFQQTNPGGYSQQPNQQSLQIQGTSPVSPFLHLQPGSQFVDKNGNIQYAVVPSTSIIQQSDKYEGPRSGIQDTAYPTSTPHNGNVFSTPGIFTPGGQLSQQKSENKLPLSQQPYQSIAEQGIPGSVITQQYVLQQDGNPSISFPQTNGKSDANIQTPFGATYPSRPGLISSHTPYQPYLGQQLPSSGTQQELVRLQGGPLPPQRGTYPTNPVTQGPIYGPEVLQQQGQSNKQQGFFTPQSQPQQQYVDTKLIYPTNIPGGILTEQPQITGQQRVPQDSSSYFPYGLTQEENKSDKNSGVTSSVTNVIPGGFSNDQQSPFIQPRQNNLGINIQKQFDQAGTKIPEQYTTPKLGLPGFTEYKTPIYNQKSISSSTPVPPPYRTTQGYVTPSSTFSYSNSQENVPFKVLPRPIRPQTDAERNADILNYQNILTPTAYSYSFDTSNGIHADENGTTIDGTRAKGSYSYIGDDGKLYKIEYTADENGFLPHGDHIPTPPPVPESIQRIIEQAERDRAAGITHDGFYDHSRYGPKRYQKHKDRHSQSQKEEDRATINDTDLPNSDSRSTERDENKYRTQPGQKPLIKYNDGSLNNFDNDEYHSHIVTDSITSKPHSIKLPGRKSGDVTNYEVEDTKTDHKQSSNKFGPDATKPISTGVVMSRRPPESADKFEKDGNKFKPHNEDDDYDFLTEDDFEPILGNNKYKRPITSKNKDFEIRKYLPSSPTYKQQGITPTQDDTSKYDKSMIPGEQFVQDEEGRQVNLRKKPNISTKAQKASNQVTTDKYEEDFDNEKEPAYFKNTQTKRPETGYSRRPQGIKPSAIHSDTHLSKKPQSARRPSFTRYDEKYQDTLYQPQGTTRPSPSIFDYDKHDTEESAVENVQPQKPSKVLTQKSQTLRKPDEDEQRRTEQSLFKKFGVKYPVTDDTDNYSQYLESPEDYVSAVRGKPKKLTSARRPEYEDTHYEQEGLQQPGAVQQEDDLYTAGDFDDSIVEKGKTIYGQGNTDDETGYQYTRPKNQFKQINSKFPTRFSDTHGATRESFTKYDEKKAKTTGKPFMTPNVSRNDDDVYDNNSEEYKPLKQPGTLATTKITTPSYEDYRTTDTNQENIRDENTIQLPEEKPKTIGSFLRPSNNLPSKPKYYENESNKNNLRPGSKNLSEFNREKEDETPFSSTSRPFDINETIGDYTEDTASTTPSTFGTFGRPSRPGSYTRVTEPSRDTTRRPSNIFPSTATSGTVYDFPDRTPSPGSLSIQPGISELAFSQPSPIKPQEGYYSTNIPGSNNARGGIHQTGNSPEDYYRVTDPAFTPQGDTNSNSGQITAIPAGVPGQPALPSTTDRPNYSVNDITRPTTVNNDAFGRPISGSITSSQNVPFTQDKYSRPSVPGSVVNAGESRFGVTTSAPQPRPAEFGPSGFTTPGYLGPEMSTNKIKGEDFSGPRQPQRFDPNTGYYY